MAKKILIASGKGGTGKTFFTSNLGSAIAETGEKVLLIDMDMRLRNLDLHLGLENKVVFNVIDLMTDVCSIEQALIRDKRFANLFLLPSSSYMDERSIDSSHMVKLCDKLDKFFDYIIIDGPTGIGKGLDISASSIDLCILIATNDVSAIRDIEATKLHLNSIGVNNICYILNKAQAELLSRGGVPTILSVADQLRIDLLGIIQYDENILISTNYGEPIILSEDVYITQNLKNITKRIINLFNE